MSRVWMAFVCSLGVLAPGPPPGEHPSIVVRQATRAVQGDSAERLHARLTAAARRDPADRAALLGIATLARLRYDYPTAEATYRRLTAGPADRYTVYAHLGLARGLEARSFGRAARAELDSALFLARRVADRTAEGEAVLWLAFSRGRLEGVAVAAALLDTAAALLPETELELWSRWHSRKGIVFALQARPADASSEVETAIALARRAGDLRAEADGLRMLGQILQYRGQFDSAMAALQRSEVLYVRARDRSALAASLIWHAQVLAQQGHYGDMRAVMGRALVEGAATHNPAATGDAHRALGVLAGMLGDWPGAAAHLKQSAAISIASGDSSGARTTRKFLAGVALVAGDLAGARRITEEALAWALRAKDANAIYEAERTMADILTREGDFPAAARALDEARRALRGLSGGSYAAWLTHDEARLALARGDLAAAERFLLTYLEAMAGARAEMTRFDAHVRLADLYARRNDLDRAERQLAAATDEIDTWRARVGDAGLRAFAFQTVATSNAAAAEPGAAEAGAARVVAALAAGGRAENAFSLTERWRARELMDRLARAGALRTGAPAPGDSGFRPRPRSAAELMAALPDDRTALLEYVTAPNAPLTLFVVQRGRLQARVLPPDSALAGDITRFGSLVESGADASRLARELGRRLLDPALLLLDERVTRLVIVPVGPLHHLPFDALRLADGRYVIERYALGFAPSASVVAGLWAKAASRAATTPVRLLALGDPAAPRAAPDTVRALEGDEAGAAVQAAGGLSRLAGAAHEARLVAKYAPAADLKLGATASAAFLKRVDLRPYRVLHFATHAIVSERSLAGTALVLAPGEGESGLVSPGDLAALRLDADLVVLSACSAAGGMVTGGEGVQGLTSPLLQAGARALVATEWRIRDRDAVPFVEALYDALATGLR